MNTPASESEAAVRTIIDQYGEQILLRHSEFIAAFRDLAPNRKFESMVLSLALYRGIGRFYSGCAPSDRGQAVRYTFDALRDVLAERMILAVVMLLFYGLRWDVSIIRQALNPRKPPEPPKPEPPAIPEVPVPSEWKIFANDGDLTHVSCYDEKFMAAHTNRIALYVGFDPVQTDTNVQLRWRIYCRQGTPVTPIIKETIQLAAGASSVHSWSPLQDSRWEAGRYRVVAILKKYMSTSAEEAVEELLHPEEQLPDIATAQTIPDTPRTYSGWFEIMSGLYDEIRYISGVNLFDNGDGTVLPEAERQYTTVFSQKTLCCVGVQITTWMKMKQPRNTCAYIKIYAPDGSVFTNLCVPVYLNTGARHCAAAVGWNASGKWQEGVYRCEVSLYGSNCLDGTFTVR